MRMDARNYIHIYYFINWHQSKHGSLYNRDHLKVKLIKSILTISKALLLNKLLISD